MKTFYGHTRLRVSAKDHPLHGKVGSIARRRISDSGAWVTMDEDLPDDLRSFSANDSRGNNVLLYPLECEPEVPS